MVFIEASSIFYYSEVEKCVSQFSRVVVVGFDNWSNIVHLFCPTHSDKVSHCLTLYVTCVVHPLLVALSFVHILYIIQ